MFPDLSNLSEMVGKTDEMAKRAEQRHVELVGLAKDQIRLIALIAYNTSSNDADRKMAFEIAAKHTA